ncbi:MAG: protein kinase [Opitutaceae bacterium]|nr:protein kinase [Opitutaceae bacterium]
MHRDDDLFAEALEVPEADRAAFLARACNGDSAQRARVEALLRGHGRAPACFDTPPSNSSPAEKPGDRIDRYRLLERIGEGGCGVVWMAEQNEPVRRRVALKVIKLGMDTREVIARFEAERQALAMMDHPNIAKVFDAGTTGTGRPYFVMELVRGIPITRYCDEANLPTEGRLQLFIQVCNAIQHAHQKGVIHRDIKPSNILVVDGLGRSSRGNEAEKNVARTDSLVTSAATAEKPLPVVIDFGIAKATQGRLTDATVFTAFAQFIGTPAYMSPEQAELSGVDIDTRSDIYSLGVLLYELLTGRPPFDPKSLQQAGLDEIRRIIREVEPARPSTRLSTLSGVDRATVAKLRGTAPAHLSTELRGDLDWIVMKSLEKNRTRRYETANGLAMDLQRHLRHEPVAARPPSAAYTLQKLVQRHRFAFGAATVVAVVLILGAAVSTWQAVRATRAEREQSRLRQTADEAKKAESFLRQLAETQELAARRRAYAADMNLLQQALATDNLGRAQELLNRQRPQPGETELRGWEWRYLWQFCRSDALSVLAVKDRAIINSVAVSADGKWLAAGEMLPGKLSVWNLQTREEIPVPAGISAVRVAFSPREPLLAIAGRDTADNRVVLWNVETRQVVREFTPGTRNCEGMFFSVDGKILVTSTNAVPNEITLWRVADGTKLASFPAEPAGRDRRYLPFAVSRDLTLAAYTSGADRKIHLVDLTNGREVWSALAADEQVLTLAFSPDGRMLASGAGYAESAIRLWDVNSGAEVGRLEGNRRYVSHLIFWPDGKTLASGGGDHTIRIWDVAQRSLLRTLRGHTSEIYSLALMPDQRTLVSGGKDGAIMFWDGTAARETNAFTQISGGPAAWRFAEGGAAIIAVDAAGQVTERRGKNLQEQRTLLEIGNIGLPILAGERPLVAAVDASDRIRVWDWERRTMVRELSLAEDETYFVAVRFLSGGEKLLVARTRVGGDRWLEEWDVMTGQRFRDWKLPPGRSTLEMSPDGRYFVVTLAPSDPGEGKAIRIELATGRETALALDTRGMAPRGASFSPDGRLFAAASWQGFVQVVDVVAWQKVRTLSGVLMGMHSTAFSPDARRLATGSSATEGALLWDVDSYERLLTLGVSGSTLNSLAFSADGNALGAARVGGGGSTTGDSGEYFLWRAPSWEEIAAAEARD